MEKSRIIEAIKTALQLTGETVFRETQENCPEDSGSLKGSGRTQDLPGEFIIRYVSEYAENVERGWSGGVVWTEPHLRNGKYVKGHYKHQPPKEGVHFIENAMKKYFKEKDIDHKTLFQRNVLEQLRVVCAPAEVSDEEV
jgi:hypothetical protein